MADNNANLTPAAVPSEGEQTQENTPAVPQMAALETGFSSAFQLVDDVVLKNYITRLPTLEVVPLEDTQLTNSLGKIRLFKITEMVYEKNESTTYKFASVFNAVAATNSAMITIIDSDGSKTDFYWGIRSLSDKNSTQTSYSTLVNAMKGQFPGTQTVNLKEGNIKALIESIATDSISAVSCVANNKNKDFIENDTFLQGLEKLALAMQGSRYTAVIVANPTSQEQLNLVREGYEKIYTQLSPFANTVVNYGSNRAETKTDSETDTDNESDSSGETITEGDTKTVTENTEGAVTETQQTLGSKVGSTIGATLSIAGAVVGSVIPGAGTAAGAAIGGAVGGLIGAAVSTATNKTISKTSGGKSESYSQNFSKGQTNTHTIGRSHSIATSLGITSGESQNLQLTIQNKPLISMLDRIDKQLDRLSEFESVGMWECAAYFLSKDSAVSEVAASTYKALMSGENTGLEVSAINTWDKPQDLIPEEKSPNELISKYILNFIHPVFSYSIDNYTIPVTPTSLVSGNELAIHMGLPRHSVCGFPVIEHADFGKEVVRYDQTTSADTIQLGKVFSMGRAIENSKVSLDVDSLAMHTFIVGATGSGKSNTIYTLLDRLTATRRDTLTFMVIEPAKGEYKRVFGHKRSRKISVFGTNPDYTKLLQINPFKFPKGIHVLEHIDRLIEIFNVCWPMYAAMPAVLKEAVLASYSACGWDLTSSTNSVAENLYPTFQDLLEQLVVVINESSYSEEVKSNYAGSLTTRVHSLTNGLNSQIFSSNEIDNSTLFDTNVIVDLSRVGSQETKALLMGVLVMRLSEHRMSCATESNSKLRHITVLEEAHNILGTAQQDTSVEGASIAGKSVEMLANAIAEMRSYGEGFIIADQSPGAVDISAIRNTNTKIIMRLPEENDRRVSGKSAALKDIQIDEIARLPKGVAVVYQNDWIEPILCKVDKYEGKEEAFIEPSAVSIAESNREYFSILINFIAHNRLDNPEKIKYSELIKAIESCDCSVSTKTTLYALANEYRMHNGLKLWSTDDFSQQARIITKLLGLENAVKTAQKLSMNEFGFTCQLNTFIAQKIEHVSDELLLTISHCLVKAYSEDNKDGVEFYKKWVDEINGRGNVL